MDHRQAEHLKRCPWMSEEDCTCRLSESGQPYYTCKVPACTRRGKACGGYCPACFAEKLKAQNFPPLELFSRINMDRCEAWHETMEPWVISDWSNAMVGEAGEAANIVKKIRRIQTNAPRQDEGMEELREMLAKELADTFCYLDLVATHAGIDLGAAIVDKFNEVSAREGRPENFEPVYRPRLPAPVDDGPWPLLPDCDASCAASFSQGDHWCRPRRRGDLL